VMWSDLDSKQEMEKLSEATFSVRSLSRLCNENQLPVRAEDFQPDGWSGHFQLRLTSSRSQRKGNTVPGGITGPPCSWRIWTRRRGPQDFLSLEYDAVNDDEFHWLRTREEARS
jgi:hypothetical protein